MPASIRRMFIRTLLDFMDRQYSAFSRLVRSTFEETLRRFDDGTVDLLHIDGLHTYDAVRHDYETWLPKLSPNAVVLLHDTNVREGDFAVHRMWRKCEPDRAHFEFLHGHGLGVLPTGVVYAEPLKFLFDATTDEALTADIRAIFSHLGAGTRDAAELLASELAARINQTSRSEVGGGPPIPSIQVNSCWTATAHRTVPSCAVLYGRKASLRYIAIKPNRLGTRFPPILCSEYATL